MTLESANICSKLLTLGAGETTQLSRAGKPQDFAPAVRREVAGLVAEANGLPSATIATDIAMCSFLYRNTFSWELAFGLGSSELDPELGEKEMDSTKAEKCTHPLCSCVATSGKYCSAECQATEKTPEIACACPHAGCKGKAH
jgi:hypothetical protein